jgi:hypothetical protein
LDVAPTGTQTPAAAAVQPCLLAAVLLQAWEQAKARVEHQVHGQHQVEH